MYGMSLSLIYSFWYIFTQKHIVLANNCQTQNTYLPKVLNILVKSIIYDS